MVVHLVNMVLPILVNLVNVVHLVHLVEWILDIWGKLDMFYYPKDRKYFIETKIFIKILIVFKNLFQSVREKVQSSKKIQLA